MQAYRFTSHEGFDHDSIDSFGYDWGRIGDRATKPIRPLKIYLPETTEDLVAVLKETHQLGQRPTIRSKGHSSNDLVLNDRGAVIGTQMMTGIVALDEPNAQVTIRSGTVLAELDEELAKHHLGLKIIGDHNHITAGGFASVGGISPASHRFGLFLDTVLALDLVTWEGEVVHYDKAADPAGLNRVLGACGRLGVIATMTLDLQRVDKWVELVHNRRVITRDMAKFIAHSGKIIADPGDAVMERGVWLEYPIGKRMLTLGQFSSYHATKQSGWARFVNRVHYGYLHWIGDRAGRSAAWFEKVLKVLGMLGIIYSPKYATLKNVETFSDRIIDSSEGDPLRMLIVLAPMDRYEPLFRGLHAILDRFRRDHDAFAFISFYVKAIKSAWLSGGEAEPFCELMLYLGIRPGLTPDLLTALVADIDALCIEQGGFRYMHTKTSKDAAIRAKVDPNSVHYSADMPWT